MTSTPALPPTSDFPIRWDDPADEQAFWFQDVMHNPRPDGNTGIVTILGQQRRG